MIGQGGPHRHTPRGHRYAGAWRALALRGVCAAAFCAAAQAPVSHAQGQATLPSSTAIWQGPTPSSWLDMQVRVAWGGGAARLWDADLELSAGAISQPVRLSMEADAPGAMALEGDRRLRIGQRSPSAYDGADFLLTAPRDATLTVRLRPRDDGRGELRRDIPVADLVTDFRNLPLDDRENRLLVRRAPGDRIRVRFDRDSLVFSPGERFEVEAIPHATGFAPQTPLTFQARLAPSDGGEPHWSQTQEMTVAPDGSVAASGLLAIPLPRDEGVYNLVLRLEPKATGAAGRAAPPALERRVQLIVIDDRPRLPAPSNGQEPVAWRPVLEIDPANPKWWERLTRWPQLPKWIPGFHEQELASSSLKTERRGDKRFVALEPGGWRAYPLPLGVSPGPHVLEVAYPTDAPQALGVSLIEPNAAGEVAPLGIDSGVVVGTTDQSPAAGEAGGGIHRVTFWPRTEAPVLLLTNLRHDHPALVGRIRVLRGPERLPEAPRRTPDDGPRRNAILVSERSSALAGREAAEAPSDGAAHDRRLLAAWFDRPLFPENFSAPDGLDETTHRSLDDWRTFHVGALRMIEYLKSRGYNAAAVAVWCEGSALYPSRLLEPTPKYDTGALFVSGQDPRRKDVAEMLFRMCDREGIRLIPVLHFSTPLPALERLLREAPEQREGLEWVNGRGRTWREERGAPRGLAPYYNPLDDRVQAAMADVVRELTERYGRHASFGGLALQLGPQSYAQLPGQFWGYDDRTVGQFARDAGLTVPGEGPHRFAVRDQWLRGEGRAAWLTWRAQRLAALYRNLGKLVAQGGPQARLYLCQAELGRCEPVEWMMRPALPRRERFADAMLHLGLAPEYWKDQPNIVLPRPRRIAPLAELPHQAAAYEIETSAGATAYFANAGPAAGLFYHETRPVRLEAFDDVSPFGAARTYTWLAPHLSLHGAENRRRFTHLLARNDVRTLFEGGWLLPLGQDEGWQALIDVYRRLPDVAFEEVAPTMGLGAQPVIVRQQTHGGRKWVYLVNDSPWPATVELEIAAPSDCTLVRLSDLAAAPLERRGGHLWWKIELAPYDVAGGVLSAGEANVVDYLATVPPPTLDELRRRIRDIGARAYQLRDLDSQTYNVLTNPNFEKPAAGGQIPGWEHRGDGGTVTLDASQVFEGGASLHLKSSSAEAPAWIRSEAFPPPPSGRLTVSMRVRTLPTGEPPELRLIAQWRRDGVSDYRPVFFGRGTQRPLGADWSEYVFPVLLPPAEVDELRVGVDLYGPGEVWVDAVRLYDARFERDEKIELQKMNYGAEHDLSQGRIADCLRFLEGYWPQFLLRYVEPPPARTVAETAPAAPAPLTAKPTMLERVRRWTPRRLLPF